MTSAKKTKKQKLDEKPSPVPKPTPFSAAKKKSGPPPASSTPKSEPEKDNKPLPASKSKSKPRVKSQFTSAPSTSKSTPEVGPSELQEILELCAKEQLLEILTDATLSDEELFHSINEVADCDVAHRKLFVYGLGWDTTEELLTSAFAPYGEIEEVNLVLDRVTGRAKGFAFVCYKTRAGAIRAQREPQKKVNNRVCSCQLASLGPPVPGSSHDKKGRRIYVSNVHPDIGADKLRSFFEMFGEIESGPTGFDDKTGKSRGYALFLYKTQEGAKKVLEEPYKMFEGHRLHCSYAIDNSTPKMIAGPGATLAGATALQNLALLSQNPALNPALSALLLANQNQGTFPINSLSGSMVSPAVGGLGSTSSLIAAYGSGMQPYQAAQLGQSSFGKTKFSGFSSLPWYTTSFAF